jgi:hypothetical protein
MDRRILALLAATFAPLPLAGQQPAPPPGCTAPEYRHFDFWVGRWNVTGPQGQLQGTNDITLEEGGCVIHEHWTGAKGGTGQSFNFYDRARGHWRQVWIDNRGNVLDLAGSFTDGRMAYTGASAGAAGQEVRHKLTFFDNSDGTVRQLWESSRDKGATWSVVFDGLYRKRDP